MNLVSLTLGAYLNTSHYPQITSADDVVQLAAAEEQAVESDEEKLERLGQECNLQSSIMLMASKDDPLLDVKKACGDFKKFRDEYNAKYKKKV